MINAAIFDMDGTLLDSVDLHAIAWQEALLKFGHEVSFEQVRGQIGKGGDKLIPVFLSADEQRDHGKELEEWRGKHFKSRVSAACASLLGGPGLAATCARFRSSARHRLLGEKG